MEISPKLLHQFYKAQRVPPLVTKFDYDPYYQNMEYSREKRSPSRNQQTNLSDLYEVKLSQKNRNIQKEIQENKQLRLLIKTYQDNIKNLKKINEQLVEKVEELQKKYENVLQYSDKNHRELNRKIRIQVYNQIQDYLRLSIQKFTATLKTIKMNPLTQAKIQQFLEQILNINNISVRKALSPYQDTKQKHSLNDQDINKTIRQIVDKLSKEKKKEKQKLYQRDNTIYQRSTSPGYYNGERKKKSLHKRIKIFDKTHQYQDKFRYEEHTRKLDF